MLTTARSHGSQLDLPSFGLDPDSPVFIQGGYGPGEDYDNVDDYAADNDLPSFGLDPDSPVFIQGGYGPGNYNNDYVDDYDADDDLPSFGLESELAGLYPGRLRSKW